MDDNKSILTVELIFSLLIFAIEILITYINHILDITKKDPINYRNNLHFSQCFFFISGKNSFSENWGEKKFSQGEQLICIFQCQPKCWEWHFCRFFRTLLCWNHFMENEVSLFWGFKIHGNKWIYYLPFLLTKVIWFFCFLWFYFLALT